MLSARRERRPPRKGAAPRSVDEGDEGLADLRRRSAKAPQHLEVRRAVGGRQDHLNNRRQPLEREFRLWIWLLPGRWCERRLVISEVGSYMLHDLLLLDAAVACPTSSRWRRRPSPGGGSAIFLYGCAAFCATYSWMEAISGSLRRPMVIDLITGSGPRSS